MTDRLMTPKQVAEYLGVSVQYLADRRFRRLGPTYVKIGTAVRYLESDIAAFVAASTINPAKES